MKKRLIIFALCCVFLSGIVGNVAAENVSTPNVTIITGDISGVEGEYYNVSLSGLLLNSDSTMLVSNYTVGTIYKVDQAGVIVPYYTEADFGGDFWAGNMARDNQGSLFVANWIPLNGSPIDNIVKIEPNLIGSIFTDNHSSMTSLAIDENNNLYHYESKSIYRTTPQGVQTQVLYLQELELFSGSVTNAVYTGATFDSVGNYVIPIMEDGINCRIVSISPTGSAQVIYSQSNMRIWDVAFDANGDIFATGQDISEMGGVILHISNSGTLLETMIVGSYQIPLDNNLMPLQIELDENDNIYFTFYYTYDQTLGGIAKIVKDNDGDGYTVNYDCDDNDPTINPGATETKHDGIDQDCNGYDLTIDINKANYDDKKDILRVEASSSLGEGAGPTYDSQCMGLTYDSQCMSWQSILQRWDITVDPAGGNPGAVTVCGIEGCESADVTIAN